MVNWKASNAMERLFGALIAGHPYLKLDYHAMALMYGEGASYDSIEGRFRRFRKVAEELKEDAQKRGVDIQNMPRTPRGPRGRPAGSGNRTPASSSRKKGGAKGGPEMPSKGKGKGKATIVKDENDNEDESSDDRGDNAANPIKLDMSPTSREPEPKSNPMLTKNEFEFKLNGNSANPPPKKSNSVSPLMIKREPSVDIPAPTYQPRTSAMPLPVQKSNTALTAAPGSVTPSKRSLEEPVSPSPLAHVKTENIRIKTEPIAGTESESESDVEIEIEMAPVSRGAPVGPGAPMRSSSEKCMRKRGTRRSGGGGGGAAAAAGQDSHG